MRTVPFLLRLSAILFTLTFLTACRKNYELIDMTAEKPADLHRASVQGKITGPDGKPLAGVHVSSEHHVTTTNAQGIFVFSDLYVSSKRLLIRAYANGYFEGSRAVQVGDGSLQFIAIQLLKEELRGKFDAASGGTVDINGVKIRFDPGSIDYEGYSPEPYRGPVSVYGAYLDPMDASLQRIMPGDLIGRDAAGNEKLLQSFGMVRVELRTTDGHSLNLRQGAKARITMPIPAALQAAAPPTLPLWYFSEAVKYWKEEGAASRDGNSYVGDVTHFSIWNCDVPADRVDLTARIVDEHDVPLPFQRVDFTDVTGADRISFYSDNRGFITLSAPAATGLLMQVISFCDQVLLEQPISPMNSATDLGSVIVNSGLQPLLRLQGKLLDCGNAPVADGYVYFSIDGTVFRASTTADGSYRIAVGRCNAMSTEITLTGVDLRAQQQSATGRKMAVTVGATAVPDISACGLSLSDYIRVQLGNELYSFNLSQDLISLTRENGTDRYSLHAQTRASWTPAVIFQFEANGTGNKELERFQFISNNRMWYPSTPLPLYITEFGTTDGSFITGRFNGQVRDSASLTRSMIGEFRVRRR